MKPIQTNTTLNIDYIPNQSLTLSKTEFENRNRGKFYFWLVICIILFFIAFGGGLIEFIDILYSDTFFILSIAGLILSIFQIKKHLPQTKYFFDNVSFQRNKIELTKNKETKSLDLKPPYLIHLVINQSEERTLIDLEYFGRDILTFQIEKIEDLPILTDGLCDLYNLELVDFFEFDTAEQMLDFYSKEDTSVIPFINIDNDEIALQIELPLDKIKLKFDWLNDTLMIENKTLVEVLKIKEIGDILWYFETENKQRTCFIYIEIEQENFTFRMPVLSQKSDTVVFQTALRFIKILKSKEELEGNDIEITCRNLD